MLSTFLHEEATSAALCHTSPSDETNLMQLLQEREFCPLRSLENWVPVRVTL